MRLKIFNNNFLLADFKSISFYTLSSLINSFVGLVMLPFVLQMLSAEEFGKSVFFSVLISLLMPIVTLNSSSLFWIEYFKRSKDQLRLLYSSVFVYNTVVSVALLILFLILNLNNFLPIDYGKNILFIPAIIILLLLQEDFKNYLIYEQERGHYLVYNISIYVIDYVGFFLLLVFYKQSYEVRIYSWFSSLLLSLAYSLFYFQLSKSLIVFKVNLSFIKDSIKFGYPLVMQTWSKLALSSSDRWFLVSIASVTTMAVYNLGYQLGAMISLLINGVLNFMTPLFIKELNNNNSNDFFKKVRQFHFYLIILLVILFVGVILFSILFPFIFPLIYINSVWFILFSGVSSLIFAYSIPFSILLSYFGRTSYLAKIGLLILLLNLISNYLLISIIDIWGAAISTILSYFVYSYFIVRAAKRVHVQSQ